MSEQIVVVDYGAANLLSITRALEAVGARVTISGNAAVIAAADGVVLPGVGAAGSSLAVMRASRVDAVLRALATAGRPILGVCLGMQLFFERLAEDDSEGLGLLPGAVPLLPPGQKIPQMGWNSLTWTPDAPGTQMFAGLEQGTYAYFVHSYHCVPQAPDDAVAWTEYGGPVCAAVARGAIWGTQFHPEKSGAPGLRLLANWLAAVTEVRRTPDSTALPIVSGEHAL